MAALGKFRQFMRGHPAILKSSGFLKAEDITTCYDQRCVFENLYAKFFDILISA